MKLPDGVHAQVALEKLRDFCLNPEHPVGKHKACVFATALGLRAEHAEELREILLNVAQTGEPIVGEQDEYGQRYVIDFILNRGDQSATVRSSWIVLIGEDIPRLTSCYVL